MNAAPSSLFNAIVYAFKDPVKSGWVLLAHAVGQATRERLEYDPATGQIRVLRKPHENQPIPNIATIRAIAASAMKMHGVPEEFHPVVGTILRHTLTEKRTLTSDQHTKRMNEKYVIDAANKAAHPLIAADAPHIPDRFTWGKMIVAAQRATGLTRS